MASRKSKKNYGSKYLMDLKANLEKASASMDSEMKNEDVVIFIGTTKSGKSSLINYIIGNSLIGKKNFPAMPVAISKFDNAPGPQIGRNSSSETITPTRWENKQKLPGLALWDSPGFNDNRGVIQDITNAYYIYKLFKKVKSVKIVLVTDINDIMNDSVHCFLMLLNAVESILKDKMIDNFSSIIVIFTKVPQQIHDNPANISTICELLKAQFFSTELMEISENSKMFLEYLIKGDNIGLFMKATEGPIDDSINVGIFDAILKANNIPENILRTVASPSISHQSKVFLLEYRQQLSSVNAFYELQDVINCVCEDFVQNYAIIVESVEPDNLREMLESIIKELSNRLDQMKSILEPSISFQKKLEMLKTLDTKIANKISADNLLEKSVVMEFIDSLLNVNESKEFSINLERIIQNVVQKINELTTSIRLKISEIEREEFNKKSIKMQEKYDQELNELREDLKKKLIENEISQEEFREQIDDFKNLNSKLMQNLETEKAKNESNLRELLTSQVEMQKQHFEAIKTSNERFAALQEENQTILKKLAKRENEISCTLL